MIVVAGLNLKLMRLETLGPLHVHYSLINYFNYFWIGVTMAYLRGPLAARLAGLGGVASSALGWGGLALFVAAAAPTETDDPLVLAPRLLLAYAGLAAIFAGVGGERSSFRAFCASPWISLIGGACYSIYLLHLQIVQMVFVIAAKAAPGLPFVGVAGLFVVSAIAATAAGLVYYVQVERRFMARDWPARAMTFARRRLGLEASTPAGVHLVIDNPPATSTVRRAESRRSAATRP
jgi:peptidoglycan/LPS O-acetylase OafA/YrhL